MEKFRVKTRRKMVEIDGNKYKFGDLYTIEVQGGGRMLRFYFIYISHNSKMQNRILSGCMDFQIPIRHQIIESLR